MKATLDHIGIAVTDLHAALAFYRDALGLDVSTPHDVPSEHVRATFVPVGQSSLELLEATSRHFADRAIHRRGAARASITSRCSWRTSRPCSIGCGRAASRSIDEAPRPARMGPRSPSSIRQRRKAC